MAFCPNCGNEVEDNATVCDACNQALEPKVAEETPTVEETPAVVETPVVEEAPKKNKKKHKLLKILGIIALIFLVIIILIIAFLPTITRLIVGEANYYFIQEAKTGISYCKVDLTSFYDKHFDISESSGYDFTLDIGEDGDRFALGADINILGANISATIANAENGVIILDADALFDKPLALTTGDGSSSGNSKRTENLIDAFVEAFTDVYEENDIDEFITSTRAKKVVTFDIDKDTSIKFLELFRTELLEEDGYTDYVAYLKSFGMMDDKTAGILEGTVALDDVITINESAQYIVTYGKRGAILSREFIVDGETLIKIDTTNDGSFKNLVITRSDGATIEFKNFDTETVNDVSFPVFDFAFTQNGNVTSATAKVDDDKYLISFSKPADNMNFSLEITQSGEADLSGVPEVSDCEEMELSSFLSYVTLLLAFSSVDY